MPDENKFALLNQIGWTETKVCGLCLHFRGQPGSWGKCVKFKYEHEKHVGEKPLGVHAYGRCRNFVRAAPRAERMLQSYARRDDGDQAQTRTPVSSG